MGCEELKKYVGKTLRLIIPPTPRDYKYQDKFIRFNEEMIAALERDPYVYVEKIAESSLNSGRWLMRARFSDGNVRSVIPEWIIPDGPALFL